jgi:hypothetical protein
MKILKKISLALLLATTGKQALATVATVATAAATASHFNVDPIPWVIGAAGGTVVYAYRTAASRAHALANGLISVFLGGVGAPYAAVAVSHYIDPVLANPYLMAGVLSATWPWAAPVVWRKLQATADVWINHK